MNGESESELIPSSLRECSPLGDSSENGISSFESDFVLQWLLRNEQSVEIEENKIVGESSANGEIKALSKSSSTPHTHHHQSESGIESLSVSSTKGFKVVLTGPEGENSDNANKYDKPDQDNSGEIGIFVVYFAIITIPNVNNIIIVISYHQHPLYSNMGWLSWSESAVS